jgi:hypothetical protein
MKLFRTTYKAKPSNLRFNYDDSLFLIGSCFSNNISEYLTHRKFKVLSNPYGILFNPISIFQCLEELIELRTYTEIDLVEHNELQHSLSHHSDFSGLEKEAVLKHINEQIKEAHHFLKQTTHLYITLGSSWVYKYEGGLVANCHKIPNHKFEKVLLNVADISVAYQELLPKLKAFNPKLKIVFTISPVRHLKDGFEENNLSKSILRTAIHQIQSSSNEIAYFPSYEIMMDDLRDYRFYEADMLHPNKTAIDYIWEQFKISYVDESVWPLMTRIENLQIAMSHQSRFETTAAHQKHLAFMAQEKEALSLYF